ncbi:Eco57I restriction-modification methylase domain-containing protein [Mycobacterium sp. Lab-001]|uniref:Eco57I restriction-modification methylase domain-containing protein n=1 Tax=Mycobacterium sp. Lab-001 TaxID=3410136 RepID=UPI003D17EE5C
MFDIFDVDIDTIIHVELRRKLASEIVENDPARNTAAKQRQLTELRRVAADLRQIADGVVAAGLPLGGKPGRAIDEAYENLRIAVNEAHPKAGDPSPALLDEIIDRSLTPTVPTDYTHWKPNHWIIEAPDVVIDHGGFDAIIGNPPFLGGQKITGALGTDIRDWLVNVVAGGMRGSADQVAYFFLRAASLLQANGSLGLIATNTVGQGDTRQVGLDAMVADGFTITRAIQSRSWPVASASLE